MGKIPDFTDDGLLPQGDHEVILPMCVSADILAIEKEAEGLLDGLLKGGSKP
jgi:hypothetical protein